MQNACKCRRFVWWVDYPQPRTGKSTGCSMRAVSL